MGFQLALDARGKVNVGGMLRMSQSQSQILTHGENAAKPQKKDLNVYLLSFSQFFFSVLDPKPGGLLGAAGSSNAFTHHGQMQSCIYKGRLEGTCRIIKGKRRSRRQSHQD